MTGRQRVPIPPPLSAQVLFQSNRTCCICREGGRPIQIHHVDEDPSNSSIDNLAVLCTVCHNDTQIRGGFGRKLDANQVVLFRDDWIKAVQRYRATQEIVGDRKPDTAIGLQLRLATVLPDIYKEHGSTVELIRYYEQVGSVELRDKFIDELLARDPAPYEIIECREQQHRLDLVPADVWEAAIRDAWPDEQTVAYLQNLSGQTVEALRTILKAVLDRLDEGNLFNAAFVLKNLNFYASVEALFKMCLETYASENDIWWQLRSLQELGWTREAKELLLSHEAAIRSGSSLHLKLELARALIDEDWMFELEKELAEAGPGAYIALVSEDEHPELQA
jgi:hypothetical protein